MEKVLFLWLKRSKTPPVKYWKLFADKGHAAPIPARKEWKRVWEEFVKVLKSNRTTIYNSSENRLNLTLIKFYFNVEWDKSRRTGREAISELEEKWWKFAVKLIPNAKILRHIKLPRSGMHLDIFWPEKMVALEVQGEQHWRPTGIFGGIKKFAERQERDAKKRNICEQLGIKLIEVSDYTRMDNWIIVD